MPDSVGKFDVSIKTCSKKCSENSDCVEFHRNIDSNECLLFHSFCDKSTSTTISPEYEAYVQLPADYNGNLDH